jgi:hypothetical protein
MSDDVIVAKAEIIERCINRAREELAASADFQTDYTRQDASIFNIERAREAAIDIIEKNLDDLLEFSAIALRL